MTKRPTYKEVIAGLKNLGFQYNRSKGSHQVWKGASPDGKTRVVIVAPHRYSDTVPPGTFSSIVRQSGYNKKEFFQAIST